MDLQLTRHFHKYHFLSHRLLYKICKVGIIIPLYRWRSRISETLNISYFRILVQGSFHHSYIHGNHAYIVFLMLFIAPLHSTAPFYPSLHYFLPTLLPRPGLYSPSSRISFLLLYTKMFFILLIMFGCMIYKMIIIHMWSKSSLWTDWTLLWGEIASSNHFLWHYVSSNALGAKLLTISIILWSKKRKSE